MPPESSTAVPLPEVLRRGRGEFDAVIAARRLGRVCFGAALVAGAVVLVGSFLSFSSSTAGAAGYGSQTLMAGAWLFACAASVVGHVVGRAVFALPGRPLGDDGLFASLAVPAVGISLFLPLSLHGLVGCVTSSPRDFDEWARFGAAVVGHAHLALAGLVVVACWRMSRGEPHRSGLNILLLTVAVAAVPGVLALGVPPLLVLVTGALFVPALVSGLSRIARAEREKTRTRA